MRTTGLTAIVVMLCMGAGLAAPAQTVPLPVPAPKRSQQTVQAQNSVPRPAAPVPALPMPLGPAVSPVVNTVKPGDAIAFDANQRAMVDRVSTYLSGVQTLVGDFVQVGPDGRRTEGSFYMQKPGKVRFEYNPPTPIDVIADGDAVVVRDRNLATQDLYPLSQTPLRFLLAGRIDLLKETNVISVSADDVFVTVVIEEKQMIVGTHRLMMMFAAKDLQLKQWTVTDPQGYDTTVAVYNLDSTKKPDPSMFKINYERMLQ
ncbi:outer membrane lipoprotein carrier protein LolA [Xanthobacteraceae bacterium Astr-EGSB]|uniref:outer membrane lipoprotein carrier protein LolA n=1 Tax=Astrobacterium formosum TaxID=3069710 RepID=UPI0027B4C42F|nr:outer membrane lipoprotein carrier protein LolA [Xanthobacteraceae bacterium Astr-EGSB]